MELVQGMKVRLENSNSDIGKVGTLHLPDLTGTKHSQGHSTSIVTPRSVKSNTYGVHTIVLETGFRYRDEGRLFPVV